METVEGIRRLASEQRLWADRLKKQRTWVHTFGNDYVSKISQDGEILQGLPLNFIPGRTYFSTPLTDWPEYVEKSRPTWNYISHSLRKKGYTVYAPYEKSDPNNPKPDGYSAYDIALLDHRRILESEVILQDFGEPSYGMGQEHELGSFIPKVGFAQRKISRLTRGTPGTLIFRYNDEDQLFALVDRIFEREDWIEEPFYNSRCDNHPVPTVHKGKTCMTCELKEFAM